MRQLPGALLGWRAMQAATQGTTTMLEAISAEQKIKDLQGRIDAALVVLDSGDWPPDVVVSVGRILRGEEDFDASGPHTGGIAAAPGEPAREAVLEDVEPTFGSQTGPAPSGGRTP